MPTGVSGCSKKPAMKSIFAGSIEGTEAVFEANIEGLKLGGVKIVEGPDSRSECGVAIGACEENPFDCSRRSFI